MCLRPEDVVVRGVGVSDRNALDATVGVMEFTGTISPRRCTFPGTRLSVSADVSINDVRDLGVTPGRTIRIALPPERLRVFVDSRAA